MKKIIVYLTLILSSTVHQSCAQQMTTNDMNEIVEQTYSQVPQHEYQPMYGLKIDKKGCKLSLSMNDLGLGDYWSVGGYSTTATINPHIIKSGKQKITVEVYPREGMTYIDDLAYVQLEVFYVEQKGDPMSTYKKLIEIKLPKNIKDKKLPYYKQDFNFLAEVPWDQSAFYDNLQDLRKVPNIEQKILAKYEEVYDMLRHNRQEEYVKFRFKNKKYEFETFYVTNEEIREYLDWYIEDSSPLLNKEVIFDRENYKVLYEKDGKLVQLAPKMPDNKIIIIEHGEVNTEGDFKGRKRYLKTIAPVLVLPKEKVELENF